MGLGNDMVLTSGITSSHIHPKTRFTYNQFDIQDFPFYLKPLLSSSSVGLFANSMAGDCVVFRVGSE